MFRPGDRVKYVGQRFRKQLEEEIGTVHSQIQGKPHVLVVDYQYQEGIDSYLLPETCLLRI